MLPINIYNVTNLLKEITTKEQFETIKTLGIYFIEDLHYANKIN